MLLSLYHMWKESKNIDMQFPVFALSFSHGHGIMIVSQPIIVFNVVSQNHNIQLRK